MQTQIKQKENKDEYLPVRSLKRSGAAILDFIFISILAIAFSFLVFINSKFTLADVFKNANSPEMLNKGLEAWRIFLMTLISLIIYFLYFIVIPTFWDSHTIFRKLLKIKIISLKEQNNKKILFISLIKHSLFTWFSFMMVNILATVCCFAFDHNKELLKVYIRGVMSTNSESNISDTTVQVLSILMRSLYSILGLVSCIIVLHMFMNSQKRALHDILANVVVLDLSEELNKKTVVKKAEINAKLPISKADDILKEIDKIN